MAINASPPPARRQLTSKQQRAFERLRNLIKTMFEAVHGVGSWVDDEAVLQIVEDLTDPEELTNVVSNKLADRLKRRARA